MMRRLLAGLAAVALAVTPALAAWDGVLERARGQTVYFNAWGGDEQINAFIAWVGERVKERHGVTVEHVKLADTGEAVARVLAEKAAGRTDGGAVDLIWINGENFAAMKREGLLHGPFTQRLPNFALVDTAGKPTTLVDFTVPTEGFESPWGMAQFVFFYDGERVDAPPATIADLLAFAEANPGRLTYPAPPDFVGTTFLKHALLELTPDPDALQRPADEADADAVLAPLWSYLDALHPHLWRGGATFPASGPALLRLLDDGEVDVAMAFNPAEASRAIAAGRLPDSVRSFVLDAGTIANTHFVAIPFNAAHKEGALVVANFLLSPEAQLRMQHPEVWGDGTVLDLARLDPDTRAAFAALPRGVATLPPEALTPARLEPHPSWTERIEAGWLQRYGG